MAAIGLFVPAIFAFSCDPGQGTRTEESVLVSVALIVGYVLSLVYAFTNPDRTLGGHGAPADHGGPLWSRGAAVGVLLFAAVLLAVLSEILVSFDRLVHRGVRPDAVLRGVVLIPTIGNLAEHLVAVQLAAKNKMEFAMAVSYGSSLQVALFVAPILVLLGAVMGQPMDLVFQPLEVAAVAAAVGISALIALDGESNWLEGALLMIVYAILAFSFFEFVAPLVHSRACDDDGAGGGAHRRGRWGRAVDQAAASSALGSSSSSGSLGLADSLGTLGDGLGRRRLAERLGLGRERIGGLLGLVVLLAPARQHLDMRGHDLRLPVPDRGRRPTSGSGGGPRWRPAGPCRGTGRRSRRAGPT